MKTVKVSILLFISSLFFSACVFIDDETRLQGISLEELLSRNELWYVDYHRTTGTGDVPFMSIAFTLSFTNGSLYANNNIVDIGYTGNGLGIRVGYYNTYNGLLETDHQIDGYTAFEVYQLSNNEIRIDAVGTNVSYYLIGYQRANFDYDQLFYDNIEYFLQEYEAWENIQTSASGTVNSFDTENFLQFTPENTTTFYASQDAVGTPIQGILWDFVGSYEVFDVQGSSDLKILTLYYDGGDTETFELTVINDSTIQLYQLSSQTTYTFIGRGFIQYLKNGTLKEQGRNTGRKRIKMKRRVKNSTR